MAKKSGKRAIEKYNGLQLDLFETFKERKRLEVIRMEIRLNKRQKIKQLFKTLDINLEPTFINLFSSDISQKVLIHYLDEIESKRLPLFDYKSTNAKSLLADLIINNPKLGIKKTIQLFGLKQLFDSMNPRELRTMFSKYSQRSWYRLIAEAKTINLPNIKNPLEIIRKNLNSFKTMKLKNFQEIQEILK